MTVEEIKQAYPFLYETHMHTKEASACATRCGSDMADAYKAYGYAGVIVTDHNWGGNTCIPRDLPWEEWIEKFFEGYRNTKARGDEIGLDVFCGYEAGYGGPEFLIYGVTPEWMAKHPELKTLPVGDLRKVINEGGGMVIQAHPFREEWYIDEVRIYPNDVEGVEIVNATHSNTRSHSHNNPEFDTKAIALAKEYNHLTTGGSDMHSTDLFGGGMAFPTKLESIQDFISRVRNRDDYVITNGEHWYTRTGDLII